jgi:hypothetical protein
VAALIPSDHLDGHVQVRELRQQPLGGLPQVRRAVDLARLGLPEGRNSVLQVLLGDKLVGGGQVLAVE